MDYKTSYEDLLDKLENGTEKEKLEASLLIIGRLEYYNGD